MNSDDALIKLDKKIRQNVRRRRSSLFSAKYSSIGGVIYSATVPTIANVTAALFVDTATQKVYANDTTQWKNVAPFEGTVPAIGGFHYLFITTTVEFELLFYYDALGAKTNIAIATANADLAIPEVVGENLYAKYYEVAV